MAALLGVLALLASATAVYAATTTTPPVTITAQPQSQTISYSGSIQSANYILSVSPNSFSGNVTLTAGSLPKGMAATWTVGTTKTTGTATVTVPAGSTSAQTAYLTISGGQVTAGTYNPTVTASTTSPSYTSAALKLTLTVASQNGPFFGLTSSASNVTPLAGPNNPTTTISIVRANWTGSVTLGAVTGLPSGVTATYTTSTGGSASTLSTTGSSTTLTINVPPSTTPGTYTLVVPGSAVLSGTSPTTNYTAFTLTVPQPGSFSISGNLASPLRLGIGGTQPLDLSITNPYSTPLTLSNIQVTLSSIKQASGAVGTCSQSGTNSPNFSITNLASSYSVTVPASSTMKLSQLGTGQTPSVTWIDQSGWAQNGCLGATLNFSYSAGGQY